MRKNYLHNICISLLVFFEKYPEKKNKTTLTIYNWNIKKIFIKITVTVKAFPTIYKMQFQVSFFHTQEKSKKKSFLNSKEVVTKCAGASNVIHTN